RCRWCRIAARFGKGRRWDDPEARVVRRSAARRRAPRAHPRRPHTPRVAAGILHPRGDRDDGRARGGGAVTTLTELTARESAPVMQTCARAPVAFGGGAGTRLWDSDGREYLDFLAGIAVVSLGHSHPAVSAAIAEQARTLVHVSNLYYNDVQPRVAEQLNALLGGGGRSFFCNSGAEANECAIKLARRYGQRNGGPER